jgi:hypothetical protein
MSGSSSLGNSSSRRGLPGGDGDGDSRENRLHLRPSIEDQDLPLAAGFGLPQLVDASTATHSPHPQERIRREQRVRNAAQIEARQGPTLDAGY